MNNPTKSMNKVNSESNYSNNFKNVFDTPLILERIFQFMEKDDIKCLSLSSKKLYQLYCKQVKKLKIKEDIEESNILKFKFDKYVDLIELDLEECENITDY